MSQEGLSDSGPGIRPTAMPSTTEAALEDVQKAVIPEVLPSIDTTHLDPKTAPNAAQWLGEIQSLQQQVANMKRERDSAYTSADTLRNLYESETRQRKREAEESKQVIARLQKELANLQTSPTDGLPDIRLDTASIRSTRSVEQLQVQLIETKKQCEQLKSLLKEEAENHAQTRESLTAALGDAVDLLAKGRG